MVPVAPIEEGAASAVRDGATEDLRQSLFFSLCDNRLVKHGKTTSAQLKSPAEVDVLTHEKFFRKSPQCLEVLAAYSEIRSGSCRKKPHLLRSSRSHRPRSPPIQESHVEDTRNQFRIDQASDTGAQPPRLHFVVGVTESKQITGGTRCSNVAGGRWSPTRRRVHESYSPIESCPSVDELECPVRRSVVGNDHLPGFLTLLLGESGELGLKPGTSIEHRDDHADHKRRIVAWWPEITRPRLVYNRPRRRLRPRGLEWTRLVTFDGGAEQQKQQSEGQCNVQR